MAFSTRLTLYNLIFTVVYWEKGGDPMRLKKLLFSDISEYLRRHYHGDEPAAVAGNVSHFMGKTAATMRKSAAEDCAASAPVCSAPMPQTVYADLNDRLGTLDESFQETLLRLIDERGMKDSTCYKRAGVDRKLFSKIRINPHYRPSKPTAVAFAIALELDLNGTADLLRKAGYALSHSSKFDVIVEYFIINRRYSLLELNEALYEFDQPLIGA